MFREDRQDPKVPPLIEKDKFCFLHFRLSFFCATLRFPTHMRGCSSKVLFPCFENENLRITYIWVQVIYQTRSVVGLHLLLQYERLSVLAYPKWQLKNVTRFAGFRDGVITTTKHKIKFQGLSNQLYNGKTKQAPRKSLKCLSLSTRQVYVFWWISNNKKHCSPRSICWMRLIPGIQTKETMWYHFKKSHLGSDKNSR